MVLAPGLGVTQDTDHGMERYEYRPDSRQYTALPYCKSSLNSSYADVLFKRTCYSFVPTSDRCIILC